MESSTRKFYQIPQTLKHEVSVEACFCASAPVTTLTHTVEVEDWVTIDNDITFE